MHRLPVVGGAQLECLDDGGVNVGDGNRLKFRGHRVYARASNGVPPIFFAFTSKDTGPPHGGPAKRRER